MLEFAHDDSPTVGPAWATLDLPSRIDRVNETLLDNARFANIFAVQAKQDGQVFVTLKTPLSASARGTLLRAAEAHLKITIDRGITLWCEPIGDKNSLRKLRGIQVLS